MHTWLPFALIYLNMSVLRDVVTLLTISFAMLDFRRCQLLEHLCIYMWREREREKKIFFSRPFEEISRRTCKTTVVGSQAGIQRWDQPERKAQPIQG